MNWLDIIFTIIGSVFAILSLFLLVLSITEQDLEIFGGFIVILFFTTLFGLAPFIIIDKASGSTIGKVTSIDKNFFGTTALYVNTSETEQEEYCIENLKVIEEAQSLIGKNIKITYGKRVGLYSTGKCHQAPVKQIELVD